MNKKELLSAISEKTGVTVKASRDVLNAFQKIILEILRRDEVVVLLDLGKFRIVERATRSVINPSTKETILVSAKKKPSLVASKKFRAFTEGSESIDSFNY